MMYSKQKYLPKILSLTLVIFLGGVLVAHAVGGYTPLEALPIGDATKGTTGYESMSSYLAGMMKFLIAIGGVISIVVAIIGGVQRIASGISPSQKADANKRIENALVGLALVLTSYLILNSINPDLVNINFNLEPIAGSTRWKIGTAMSKDTPYADCPVSVVTSGLLEDTSNLDQGCEQEKAEKAIIPTTPTSVNNSKIIESLSSTAKATAEDLLKKCPNAVLTSGGRDILGQAKAMADNIVSSKKRDWIQRTYKDSTAKTLLQNWVNAHPEAVKSYDIQKGLFATMSEMPSTQIALISKHLSGDAFDVRPGDQCTYLFLYALPGFINGENGVNVWHIQF